jgi:hypothetical protein
LSDFPEPLITGGLVASNVFYIGDGTYSTSSKSSNFNTFLSLEYGVGVNFPLEDYRDLTSIDDKSLIVLGGYCTNSLVGYFSGIVCESWPYETNQGYIEVMANGDDIILVLTGQSDTAVGYATSVMSNYHSDYEWCGTRALVEDDPTTNSAGKYILTFLDEGC